jgi:hypothetical protein
LQVIMQVVVTELCASLIFPWADALTANPAIANATVHKITPAMPRGCMMPLPYVGTIIAVRRYAGNAPPRAGDTTLRH